ncbi:MAG: hypothetical protein O2894_01415 [Planctomycetota bacterium]|nr:hypothetical protein [Planctomycetota bacterium]
MRRSRFFVPVTRLTALLAACVLAGLHGGCGDGGEPQTITDVRVRPAPRFEVPVGMDAAERYGMRRSPPPGHGAMEPAAPQLEWQTPAGWEQQPGSAGSMRVGSWRIAGDATADCSLVVLPGSAGGIAANVNRWRGEMGLDALDAPGIAELPRRALLGGQAVALDLEGTFSGGRGGGEPIAEARLLGLVYEESSRSVFLKFTGPAATVEAQRAAFEALADSLQAAAAPPANDTPPGGSGASSGLAWDAPEGWGEQPARMMRVVTFVPASDSAAWCYVSRLGGEAGGLAANVNRWRGEMGATDQLDDAAVAALPTIDVLGTRATLLDLEGDFSGTGGPPQAGAHMLGVVCVRPAEVLFVKMVGPTATIAAERERFLAFCASLREAR